MFYGEEVLVCMKSHNELIKKAFCTKDALERHLKGSVRYERNPSRPREAWVMRQAQLKILELNWSTTPEQFYGPFLTTSVANANNQRLRYSTIKDCKRRACID